MNLRSVSGLLVLMMVCAVVGGCETSKPAPDDAHAADSSGLEPQETTIQIDSFRKPGVRHAQDRLD